VREGFLILVFGREGGREAGKEICLRVCVCVCVRARAVFRVLGLGFRV
jgi:hypothetical protein